MEQYVKEFKARPNTINIQDLQLYLKELYPNNNVNWQELFGYLARSSGYLSKLLIQKKYTSTSFMRALSYLATLANKVNIDLYESFVRKFPNACPYCLSKQCQCSKSGKMPSNGLPAWKIDTELEAKYETLKNANPSKKSITGFAVMLEDIYPSNRAIWEFSGPWRNISKLSEEVSELHEAIAKHSVGDLSINNVGAEFADVLAWLLTTRSCNEFNQTIGEEIVGYYFDGCPLCKIHPCNCQNGKNRNAGLVDVDKLDKVKGMLEELKLTIPESEGQIEDLIRSTQAAIDSKNEVTSTSAINQTKQKLDSISTKLNSTATMVESGSKALKSIKDICELLQSFF
jgi:NTP pyrophosphatase (non-canonical NTP hydrolase)